MELKREVLKEELQMANKHFNLKIKEKKRKNVRII